MSLPRIQGVIFSRSFLKLVYPLSRGPATTVGSPLLGQSGHNIVVPIVCALHTSSCLLAGHSKWQNIKHIKAANDQAKASIALQLAQKVQMCLVKNPNTDPKLNTQLAQLIKQARSNNIPNDTINKVVDRQIKLRDPKNIHTFSGTGPGNTAIVIECSTLKLVHTQQILQNLVKRGGFSLSQPADDMFEHKALVDVDLPDEDFEIAETKPDDFDLDKYVDMAIEIGAEDVTLEKEDEKPYLKFVCGPQDMNKVVQALTETGLSVINAARCYLPTTTVPCSAEFLEHVDKMTEKLDAHPDVVKFYLNLIPEEAEAAS